MKILYVNGGALPTEDLVIDKLKAAGHEVVFFNSLMDREDKLKTDTKHFQMYQKVLNTAEEQKFDLIYFYTIISMPEYLLFELRARPNFKPKIVFHLLLRGLDRSFARCLALKELVDMPQIAKVVIATVMYEIEFPDNFLKAKIDASKLRIFENILSNFNAVDESVLEEPDNKVHSKAYFGFDPFDTAVLLSGTWAYIKGVDLFVESLKYLSQDILVVIHRHEYGMDSSLDPELLSKARKLHPNLHIIDRYLSNREYPLLFRASDIIVMAHRRSYAYCDSGIPQLAFQTKRLLVAPDFPCFNKIIKKFKIGAVYEPENPLMMARTIETVERFYSAYLEEANFDGFAALHLDASDTPLEVLKEL
jgi:glycosyltransferase involved in cell wall biosynthesis